MRKSSGPSTDPSVYMRKISDPSTDPYGTPQDRGTSFDFSSFTLTN